MRENISTGSKHTSFLSIALALWSFTWEVAVQAIREHRLGKREWRNFTLEYKEDYKIQKVNDKHNVPNNILCIFHSVTL
jgi:hypothetical protein